MRFFHLLEHAHADLPIVVLLDGMDQLKDGDEFKNLFDSLPFHLPNYVKMIFSCTTGCKIFPCTAETSRYSNGIFADGLVEYGYTCEKFKEVGVSPVI